MSTIDLRIDALARVQDNVISRRQVLDAGGTDEHIANRLARGLWQPLQAGVYLVGSAPPTWAQSLRAGLLAAGPGAEVANHRATSSVWPPRASNGPCWSSAPAAHRSSSRRLRRRRSGWADRLRRR